MIQAARGRGLEDKAQSGRWCEIVLRGRKQTVCGEFSVEKERRCVKTRAERTLDGKSLHLCSNAEFFVIHPPQKKPLQP